MYQSPSKVKHHYIGHPQDCQKLTIYTTIAALCAKICPKKGPISTRTVSIPLQSSHKFSTPTYCQSATFGPLAFCISPLFFTTKNQKEFRIATVAIFDPNFIRQLSRRCRHRYTAVATLTARWRYGTRSRAVAMSKSKPDVSKMTHRFLITINSMILYFKHIIHIDDFPLNVHPPSITYYTSILLLYL